MIKKGLLAILFFYKRVISPLLGNRCRFYPTCSDYMAESIRLHGVFRGIGMGTGRLLKCHPFHPGGYDPVPEKQEVK